jgi:hypothetical protein
MFIDRELREKLNALSKEVFGVSSKWKSILDHGTREIVTETKNETIPGENGAPDQTEEIKIPVKHGTSNKYQTKYYTITEVHEMLLKLKKGRDAQIERYKAAQAQKELEKKVNEEAQGRVVG